ncbi:hypothetical protein C8R44DRAFT_729245 [Mycena epipterygia]|nr:hypothetical protein C8R44DRAFT_729245 [Mycena epipterygia]
MFLVAAAIPRAPPTAARIGFSREDMPDGHLRGQGTRTPARNKSPRSMCTPARIRRDANQWILLVPFKPLGEDCQDLPAWNRCAGFQDENKEWMEKSNNPVWVDQAHEKITVIFPSLYNSFAVANKVVLPRGAQSTYTIASLMPSSYGSAASNSPSSA